MSMTWTNIAGGLIIVVTLIGIAIGGYPALKMNRATIALVGATFLVAIGVMTLDQAYRAVDWNTIVLLLGMMVLNVNLRMAGFFHLVTARVLRFARTPRRLLALIIVVAGVFAAVFLNDTIVLVFTPLVLDIAVALRRNPIPYLMALATAANVGSTASITGNPQNMLVGISSGIPFLTFVRDLGPIALLGLGVIWVVIVLVYRSDFRAEEFETAYAFEPEIKRPRLRKSLFATAVMLVALVIGTPVPLAAILAAAILLVTRRTDPAHVFQEIDWALLVFFSALFVVTGAIETAGFDRHLFAALAPYANGGPGPLSVVAVVLSNLVSNVPAVMLFRPVVPSLTNPHLAWLTLAMATTLAGNLTLLGSVANLIVAEIARARGVKLSFAEYLKAGTAIALITLAIGVAWLTWA
ncbi:MAG TPA: anion transporter [Opitutaceae bacterium]|nr:anion transporter [Opitutaceae bacterium]